MQQWTDSMFEEQMWVEQECDAWEPVKQGSIDGSIIENNNAYGRGASGEGCAEFLGRKQKYQC
jgi:hypothetical protein